MSQVVRGTLEVQLGTARQEFAKLDMLFQNEILRGLSLDEWLRRSPADHQFVIYAQWQAKSEELALWGFLLDAAFNWEPGDTVIDVTRSDDELSFQDVKAVPNPAEDYDSSLVEGEAF